MTTVSLDIVTLECSTFLIILNFPVGVSQAVIYVVEFSKCSILGIICAPVLKFSYALRDVFQLPTSYLHELWYWQDAVEKNSS